MSEGSLAFEWIGENEAANFCKSNNKKVSKAMTFNPNDIKTTAPMKAPLVCIFALNGAGKSSFFASVPNPFVIDTENKFKTNKKVSIYAPKTFDDIKGCLEWYLAKPVLAEEDPEKNGALCIDSVDWLEKAIHTKILIDFPGASNINDDKIKALNFYKGNDIAANIFFADIYPLLTAIRLKHGIPIVIGAQADAIKQKRADQDEYSLQDLRVQPKLGKLISDLMEAKVYLKKHEDVAQNGKIYPSEQRYIITREAYGVNAKNNLDLPEKVSISCYNGWNDFCNAIGKEPAKE